MAAQAAAADKPAAAASTAPAQAAEEEESEPTRILKGRFSGSGPDLKQELQEIVKENPDAAVTILRAWIGEAA
jgi:flagellar biosynthesis/type III secretory pathway M-ring protein FliF/YscJ